MRLRSCAAVLAVVSFGIPLACQPQQGSPDAVSAAGSEVAASVDGQPITLAELDAYVKESLFRKQTDDGNPAKLFALREDALDSLITERVLDAEAARRNLGKDELIEQEVAALGPVSDEEIAAFYEENRERVGERSLEDLQEPIRDYLESRRHREAITAIRERADVKVALEPPRFEVSTDGPAIGPESAPITIVEFSDFQCPFCQRASNVVKEVRERYPNDVRVVYKQFPLENIHPDARAAAEASLCAADQDRFWDYHDVLFENRKQLSSEDLVRYATQLQLDMPRFQQCIDERTHEDRVDQDVVLGEKLGVTGTPAFFVNGIMLSGARPVESFAELIDQELARLGRTGSKESS